MTAGTVPEDAPLNSILCCLQMQVKVYLFFDLIAETGFQYEWYGLQYWPKSGADTGASICKGKFDVAALATAVSHCLSAASHR